MGIPNYLMALANHEGPATLNAGGLSIPVKIMDINHEYDPRRCIDACEFKGLVVNQDQIKPTALDKLTKHAMNALYGANPDEYHRQLMAKVAGAKALSEAMRKRVNPFEIRKVIFNNPATIVYWADGEKTVVKCQEGDVYSKETGLALCIAKKALGNKGNFNDVFHEWIPEEEKVEEAPKDTTMKFNRHTIIASDGVSSTLWFQSDVESVEAVEKLIDEYLAGESKEETAHE